MFAALSETVRLISPQPVSFLFFRLAPVVVGIKKKRGNSPMHRKSYEKDRQPQSRGLPEKQIAKWAAIRYSSLQILDYIELDDRHSLYEVPVPESWVGKNVVQLDVRRKYNLNIIAIKRDGDMNFMITPETTLTAESSLLVLGEYKAIQKCFRL